MFCSDAPSETPTISQAPSVSAAPSGIPTVAPSDVPTKSPRYARSLVPYPLMFLFSIFYCCCPSSTTVMRHRDNPVSSLLTFHPSSRLVRFCLFQCLLLVAINPAMTCRTSKAFLRPLHHRPTFRSSQQAAVVCITFAHQATHIGNPISIQ